VKVSVNGGAVQQLAHNSDTTPLKLAHYSLTRSRWTGSQFSESVMKQRFILFRRAGVFYCEDSRLALQSNAQLELLLFNFEQTGLNGA
jgi:hypothetical protein